MRTTVIAFCLSLFLCVASRAGTQGRVFLPDLLPQTTIACLVPADNFARNQDFTGSLYQRLASLPDMAAFFESFENSKRLLANDIAQTAQIQPALAMEILDARIGGALLGLNLDRRGEVQAEFVIVLSLASQPSRDTVFSAVMALLNRPEVVAQVLESQGMDPNTPLRSLAQEETLAGYPPMLRIGPSIRIAAIGNLILLYHGQSSESITKIFDAMANPATSLSRLPAFQAAFRGAETEPGMSFTYLNMPRVLSLLDLLNYGSAAKVVEAVGIGSATSLGLAGGYHNEGMRHNLFVYAPGGLRNGLLSALMPMPDGPYGMEAFANILPSTTKSFSSIRFDANVLMAEMPYFLSAIGKSVRPGGVSSLAANETVLGVPLAEIFPTLGADVVVRSHDDTQVLHFNNVDVPRFEALVARMEQNAGERFSSLQIGGYRVRYYNRRASMFSPLAPAFCLMPHQQGGNKGLLLMASHPQALVSLIREATATRETLATQPDFAKVMSGLGNNFSFLYYHDSRGSYPRVYNFLLPLAAMWASSTHYPVDTGLLPTAATIAPAMFGCAIGMKQLPDGISIQAYSPLGFHGLTVNLADRMVVSNPLVIGYLYSMIDEWMAAIPDI